MEYEARRGGRADDVSENGGGQQPPHAAIPVVGRGARAPRPALNTNANDSDRYWAAVDAGDLETAKAIEALIASSLRRQGEEVARQGLELLAAALHLEAGLIEKREIPAFPRDPSFPLSAADVSRLTPGRRLVDRYQEEWVVAFRPLHDRFGGGRSEAWTVTVRRTRDGAFTLIDCRDPWRLLPTNRALPKAP